MITTRSLANLTEGNVKVHPCCCKWEALLSGGWAILRHTHTPHPFTCGRTLSNSTAFQLDDLSRPPNCSVPQTCQV